MALVHIQNPIARRAAILAAGPVCVGVVMLCTVLMVIHDELWPALKDDAVDMWVRLRFSWKGLNR